MSPVGWIDLAGATEAQREAMARILVDAFAELAPDAWPTIGAALVGEIERLVADRGGITLWVGTDDETDRTTLARVDLYPDVLGKLAALESVERHPFEFYRRMGFEVVGVVPDANGFGKPDILMAKRVER